MAAKNEAKIKFSADTEDFRQGIKEANNTLSSLKAELKLNDAQMKASGATVEALQTKHKNLEQQLIAQQSKTKNLSDTLAVAVARYGENSDEATKYRNQLIASQAAEVKLETAIRNCSSQIEAQAAAQARAKSETGKLTDSIAKQQDELNGLKKEYVEAVLKFGATSDEAQALAGKIDELSGDLKESKDRMDDAKRAADELDRSINNVGDGAENAGDGFTVFKGMLADLASNAIQAVVGKLGELIGYFKELPEATRELRQDMSTLTTAFDNVGFSSETAKDTWKELYAVFGEDDRAVEAANNISRMADSQKELDQWVRITTGIWGTYQDALPVEGLAEAAGETAKTGKVTGVLADALNWSSEAATMFADYMSEDVTNAEDAFNVALSECTTEAERQALITETLTNLYGGAADTYRDTASAQMEAKEATAENILAEANLADAIEPTTTAWDNLKSQILIGVLPAIESITNIITPLISWLGEHPAVLTAIAVAIGVISVALGVLTVAATIQTIANSALFASFVPLMLPILGIVAAIAAVIAIVILCVKYWDEIKAAGAAAWNWIKETWSRAAEWFNTNVIQPIVNFFSGLWDGITSVVTNVWETIKNVVQIGVMFIGSIISAAFNIITLPFRFIWENCKDIIISVWNVIKGAVATAVNAVKETIVKVFTAVSNFIAPIWEGVKNVTSTVWNGIKNTITNIVNSIKNTVTNIFNSIKSVITSIVNGVKSVVSTVFNAIKNAISTPLNAAKSVVSSIFNGIKTTISNAINGAKSIVQTGLNAIKGFFNNLKLKFPNIKLPHFKITGEFSLKPPKVPKLGIDWYAEGGILTQPTIFGYMGGNLLGGGEAGAEAVLPIDKLQGYIINAIDKTSRNADIQTLARAVEDLAKRPINLDINGRRFAVATAADTDSVSGSRLALQKRGLAV